MTVDEWMELAASAAQLVAFLGAAAFFGYKVVTGYLIVNASVSGTTARVVNTSSTDLLSVAATIKKGAHGSLELHDARARISWAGGSAETQLSGAERLSFKTEPHSGRKRVAFDKLSAKAPLIRLATGEETTFSAVLDVPSSVPCTVEIVFMGKRTGRIHRKVGQWRCSLISLPSSSKKADSEAA